MKHNMFILIPAGILTAVLLLTGICFAAAYISPGQPAAEEDLSVQQESIIFDAPVVGEVYAEAFGNGPKDERDTSSAYKDENGNEYFFNENGKLYAVWFRENINDTSRGAALSEDELIDIARDVLSDYDLSRFTDISVKQSNGSYKVEFGLQFGVFETVCSYDVELRPDGTVLSIYIPSNTMDDFNPALIENVTMDDIYEFCDAEIDGEYNLYGCRIQKYDGNYVVHCCCIQNEYTEDEEIIDLRYPLG